MNLSKGTWLVRRANPVKVKVEHGYEYHENVGQIRDGVCYRDDGWTRNHGLEYIIDQVNRGVAPFKARRLHCINIDHAGWEENEKHALEDIAHTF